MEAFVNGLKTLCKVAQNAGPYVLLEIVMPGGTLCAVLLYLWQRRNPQAAMRARQAVENLVRTLARATMPRLWMPVTARVAVRLCEHNAIERR
jgi:hypothetical protein